MKLLIDTNVVLDILLHREPYQSDAAKIVVLSEKGYITSFISASAVTDIYYIAQKELKNKKLAVNLLTKLFEAFHIATVSETTIHEALELNWDDFEDCVQYVVGKNICVDYLITRNAKDFAKGEVDALSPKEFLEMITSH